MIFTNDSNKALAIHLLRISFGINFLLHGLVRLPNLDKFALGMEKMFADSMLPTMLITPIAYIIPIAELLIGLFLLANKYTRATLIVTFMLMNVLVVGSSIIQKWDLVATQATYIGFLFLLLYFMDDNNNASTVGKV